MRGELKNIYDGLSNQEKRRWADNSNYSNYKGLYRYISNSPNEEAYSRVVNGLLKTVGQTRFDGLLNNGGQLGIQHVFEFKKELKEIIFKCNDENFIKDVKQNIETLINICDNQIERLKLEAE